MRKTAFLLIALGIIIADQLSKSWIISALPTGQVLFDIGFFRIINVQNTGAAFGIFQGYTIILTYVSAIGAVIILLCALLARRYFPIVDNRKGMAALGLVLGGTVGNFIDRIRQGYVTDFLDFNIWPTFNVADSAVTVGALILAFTLLTGAIAEKHSHE